MTRKTYCGNLLWQSGLTLLAHGLQFHDVAVVATDAIADDIRRVMGILCRR